MLTIKTPRGEFTEVFRQLYQTFSSVDLPDTIETDIHLSDYVHEVGQAYGYKQFNVVGNTKPRARVETANKAILVAFSGGKDSLANAIQLQQQGQRIQFYHVMGINPSYTNEWKGAKRIADKMGIAIQFAKVAQSGHTDFLESPIKNALILAMMVDAGLKQGITQYSLGSARDETVDTLDSMASLSDAVELYGLLETYYKQYIPDFKLVNTVENEKQSYQTILSRDADLLRYTVSCMTPYRFQKHLRRTNAKKYGVALTKGCGLSCFKCCHELLVLDKAGITKLPPKARAKCLAEIQAYDKRAGRTHTINRWI